MLGWSKEDEGEVGGWGAEEEEEEGGGIEEKIGERNRRMRGREERGGRGADREGM